MEKVTESFQNIRLGGKIETSRGILKLNQNGLGWRTAAGGKKTVPAADIEHAEWIQTLGSQCQLKLKTKGNTAITFDGFHPSDKDRIKSVFTDKYNVEITDCKLATRGWNFGEAAIHGPTMGFRVDGDVAFEIPLADVIQAQAPTKNEVTMEFNHPDLSEETVCLMEMRLYMPCDPEDDPKQTPAARFHRTVLKKADIASTGRGIVRFSQLPVLTPRNRYDVELYQTYFKMHSRSYDYKIPYETITRLTYLIKPDERHVLFIVSLDPPVRQGHTTYPHVLFQFPMNDELVVDDLNLPADAAERYPGLESPMTGSTHEVVRDAFRAITKLRLTKVGGFRSSYDAQAIKCSLKANDGYLYPMERNFFFVHKPPTYIRYDTVESVEFARVGTGLTNRTFDLIVLLKNDTTHVFTSLPKEEYNSLLQFLRGKVDIKEPDGAVSRSMGYAENSDSDEDSDEDGSYRARPTASRSSRPSRRSRPTVLIDRAGGGDDDSESDEDFMAMEEEEDVPEEYDENAGDDEEGPAPEDSDEDDDYGGEEEEEDEEEEEKAPKKKKKGSKRARSDDEGEDAAAKRQKTSMEAEEEDDDDEEVDPDDLL